MSSTVQDLLKSYLRPYQRRFIEDSNNRLICLKARQIGMSETVSILALLTALSRRRHDVFLASLSLREAKELLRTVAKWIEVLRSAGLNIPVKKITATVIEFSNSSRIVALPAKSIRGRSGTIILDEFAFYVHDREVWKAVSPAAEARKDLRIILISTPWGASGVFYDIWSDKQGIYGDWSRHEIDVYQAAAEGFPVDPEGLKQRNPSDIFEQEFCCKFQSDINQYFSHELLRRSLYDPDDFELVGSLFAGIDLASRRDGSVFSPITIMGDARYLHETTLLKPPGEAKDYTEQEAQALEMLSEASFEGIAVDATGEGAQLGQNLRRIHKQLVKEVRSGDWKTVYEDVPKIRKALEQGKLWIPTSDRRLISAFGKIERKESTNKTVKYEATRDKDGHGDEFSAALLAFHISIVNEAHKDRAKQPLLAGTRSSRFGGSF